MLKMVIFLYNMIRLISEERKSSNLILTVKVGDRFVDLQCIA